MPKLTKDRLNHMHKVAEVLYNISPEDKKEEMYVLGFLHDIGYLYSTDHHSKSGANLLKLVGYKYWKEIKYHGTPNPTYMSHELNELNRANLCVNSMPVLVC